MSLMNLMFVVVALAPVAAAQQDIERDHYGWSVARIGDIDGDRVPDMAVSCVQSAGSGGLWIESGATGANLLHVVRPALDAEFGYCVAGVGDVDRDGKPDVAVGAPGFAGRPGCVVVISGASGRDLAVLGGDVASTSFGQTLAAGDLDRDGVAELIVGAPHDDVAGANAGAVFVFAIQPRRLLQVVRGRVAGSEFGTSLAFAGDLDRDGFGDVWVGAPSARTAKDRGCGEVALVSGRHGRLLRSLFAEPGDGRFGISLCALDDLDGDGLGELAIGAPSKHNGGLMGEGYVFSPATGECLDRASWLTSEPVLHGFGASVADVGDLDGDGADEVAFGTPDNMFLGGVHLRSAKKLALIREIGGENARPLLAR